MKYIVTENQLIALGRAVDKAVRSGNRYIGDDLKEFQDCKSFEYEEADDWRKIWKDKDKYGRQVLYVTPKQALGYYGYVFEVSIGRYEYDRTRTMIARLEPETVKIERWAALNAEDEILILFEKEQEAREWVCNPNNLGVRFIKIEGAYER